MNVVPDRLVILEDGGLGPEIREIVSGPVLPSIEAWLVLPLVILPAEHQRVLYPDKVLTYSPSRRLAGHLKVHPLRIRVPDVETGAGPHHRGRIHKRGREELPEGLAGFEMIVPDLQFFFRRPLVIDVVGRVRHEEIRLMTVNQSGHLLRGDRVPA